MGPRALSALAEADRGPSLAVGSTRAPEPARVAGDSSRWEMTTARPLPGHSSSGLVPASGTVHRAAPRTPTLRGASSAALEAALVALDCLVEWGRRRVRRLAVTGLRYHLPVPWPSPSGSEVEQRLGKA